MEFTSLWGASNNCFCTLEELIFIQLEVLHTLKQCPLYVHSPKHFTVNLPKQNPVFCKLKLPVSLALAKHKRNSWKTPKPTHWRKLRPHKWMARSWYTLGRTIDNANLWLEAFWCNSGFWWFKVVYQNTTIYLLYLFRRKLRIQTYQYIYVQGLPNIIHRTLPTFSPRVQGQAVLGCLHIDLPTLS